MTTFSFLSVASDLRRTGLVVLLLAAGVSNAQEPPVDYTGTAFGDRVRVTLQDGPSVNGHRKIAHLNRLNSPALLEPGVRVRVKARELGKSPVIGTVVSVDKDGILLLQPVGKDSAVVEQAAVSFPVASANSFEISQGVRTYPEWTIMKGLGIGAGLGTVGGVIFYSAKSNEYGSIYAVPAGAIVGAAVGLLYGVISAVYEKPTEQWQTVPLSRVRLSLGMPRRDRFDPPTSGLTANVTFQF